MKLYQIKHINEEHNPNDIMGYELQFVHAICPITGTPCEPHRQPDQWDHVERLTNQLFLAWDNEKKIEGTVYFGKFVKL